MHSDVIADRPSQEFVKVNKAAGDKRPSVLGGNHNQICPALFSCCANGATDVFSFHMDRLEIHAETSGSLHRSIKDLVSFAAPPS